MGDIQKYVNNIWEEPINLEKYRRYIMIDGMKLPVLDLEYEYNAYMKLGRIEKAFAVELEKADYYFKDDSLQYCIAQRKSCGNMYI